MSDLDLVNLTEARTLIGVSKTTMARLVREGEFTIYLNPRDRREKLVDRAEIDEYLEPRVADRGKAAA